MQFKSKITPNVIAKDEVLKQSQNQTQSRFGNSKKRLLRFARNDKIGVFQSSLNEKIERLKRKGVIMTLQRLAVLEFLENSANHPTVEGIYAGLKEKYPTLSKATVYTSLQVLKGAGEIQELSIRKEKVCFDPNPKPHHHFYCEECKKILDIDIDCPLAGKRWLEGHKVRDVQAYLYGTCSYCVKEDKK